MKKNIILKVFIIIIATILLFANNSIAAEKTLNEIDIEEKGANQYKSEEIRTVSAETLKGQTISNGAYIIKSALNKNYVLDVSAGSKADCANIQLWSNASVPQQRYKVEYIGDGYYKIISVNSNKVLDIENGIAKAGTNVQQYGWNNSNAQKWIIKDAGDGYYYIISKSGGLYLHVSNEIAKDGANIQIYTGNQSNAQKFIFEKYEEPKPIVGTQSVKDGIYIIKSALNKNYVLDVSAGSKADCANIQLWSNASVPQQRYKVEYIGDGYYKIISVNSNNVLDIENGTAKAGTNVQQYGWNNSNAQKWIIKDAGNGYYYIISKSGELYLDVSNGIAKNGANIQIYTGNQSNAQKFIFEKYEEPKPIVGTQTISDGTYIIKSALNKNYVLDVSAGSKVDCANIQLWSNASVPQQRYKVEYIGDGYYKIISVNSNKVLDIENGTAKAGTNVQQYGWNNSNAQKWIIKDAGDGYYYIISKSGELYLDVSDGIVKNGANVQIYTGNQSNAQKFIFEKYEKPKPIVGTQSVKDGIYIIKSALNKNYVLDVSAGSKADCANIQLWSNASVSQQRYKVEYIGDGYYKIISIKSKKVLDVKDGISKPGANVQQYGWNNSNAQKWIIKDAGNGYYYIITKNGELYLDVSDGIAKDGANIQIYTGNQSNAQKFIFEEATAIIDIDKARYPGYKEKIEKLMVEHPNWNFEFLYTGLKFSDAVAGEYSVRKRNLVPTDYSGEWIAGTELYDTGWYAASQKAIAYYMDPRNFLDDVNIFQFQDVNEYINGVCTLNGIQTRVSGSFLEGYAVDIDTACKNKNVNPYYIIARLFQENGTNPKNGTHKMEGGDGKYYYNPFNIGATGDSTQEVYNNALARAKKEGWDTMTKALEGGIHFCKVNWLDNYQNTLYQNRFDIDTRNGSALYTHQYMQNLMGAYSEAKLLRTSYVNTDKIDSNFTFIIPVYEGMDTTLSPMPVNGTETYAINVRTTGTQVRIRKDANISSDILRTIENKGTILLSVQRGINSNWQKVITSDGLIGYVSGDFLEQVDDVRTCNYTAKVKTNDGDGCYIRIGPSKNLEKIRALSDGTEVTVIDDSTYKNITGYDWSRIILSNGTQAFMPSIFLAR